MKQVKNVLILVMIIFLLSSCATIIGGSNYNAHVVVNGSPTAKIMYKNDFQGTGYATFRVPRREANKLAITIVDEGCEDETFRFQSRSFRGWAFLGSLIGFTLFINNAPPPIPIGIAVDMVSGALWKPNVMESGVSKLDYKNFKYSINYTGCKNGSKNTKSVDNRENTNINTESYIDVVYLNNGNILRGMIIEQIPNVQIKIKTLDNNVFVFQMKDILKIAKELK